MTKLVDATDEKQRRDLKLAAFIAAHCAVRTMDHLCDLLKSMGHPTAFGNLEMHRTKCGNLIQKDLVRDIGERSYSLIVDESTDISVLKYLCVCVKYFSNSMNRVTIAFLGIIPVVRCTADDLFAYLTGFLKEIKLKVDNLIGLGTDGANNLCGEHNSLYSRLRDFLPNLQLVRCVCHSLDNASSKAASCFPANIDFLCREIYNWYKHSTIRQDDFQKIYSLMNINEKDKKSSKFIKLCKTRWLCMYNVVNRIRENWPELQAYFSVITVTDKDYTARTLNNMLQDKSNYLYLCIIEPILEEINQVHSLFQSNNVGKAFADLENLFLFICGKIFTDVFVAQKDTKIFIDNLSNKLAFVTPDKAGFGILYQNAIASSYKIDKDEKASLELRAFTYLKTLAVELAKRLPKNLNHLKKVKYFSPDECLSHKRSAALKDLPFINEFARAQDLSKIEKQYNKLLFVDWKTQIPDFAAVSKSSYDFWPHVLSYTNAAGVCVFEELAEFVIKVLTLPTSNAVVERAFSVMNAVKTKARNPLKTKMLDSVLRLRLRFYELKICCNDFEPTKKMLQNFNHNIVYVKPTAEINENTENIASTEETFDLVVDIDLPCIC